MTPPDLKKLEEELARAGYDPASPRWVRARGGDAASLPAFQRHRELLRQIASLIEGEIRTGQEELDSARESLHRLRNGGAQ